MQRACSNIGRIAGEVFNVGGGPENTISIWTEFRDLLRPLVPELPSMEFGEFRPGDQKIYVSDIRKAQSKLGWSPKVKINEGLSLLIDNWKQRYNSQR
jgi:CDP-paratose 2-epimerase